MNYSGDRNNVVRIRTSDSYKECQKQLRKWRSVKDVDREIIVRKLAILEAQRDLMYLEKRKRKILRRFK